MLTICWTKLLNTWSAFWYSSRIRKDWISLKQTFCTIFHDGETPTSFYSSRLMNNPSAKGICNTVATNLSTKIGHGSRMGSPSRKCYRKVSQCGIWFRSHPWDISMHPINMLDLSPRFRQRNRNSLLKEDLSPVCYTSLILKPDTSTRNMLIYVML